MISIEKILKQFHNYTISCELSNWLRYNNSTYAICLEGKNNIKNFHKILPTTLNQPFYKNIETQYFYTLCNYNNYLLGEVILLSNINILLKIDWDSLLTNNELNIIGIKINNIIFPLPIFIHSILPQISNGINLSLMLDEQVSGITGKLTNINYDLNILEDINLRILLSLEL